MKRLLKYKQFNEQYLPYFGVKQAIDDSVENEKTPDFKRIYTVSSSWWNNWKEKYQDAYDVTEDSYTKTYTVIDKTTGNIVFIFDYRRYKIFTNEKPQLFILRGYKPKENPESTEKIEPEDKTQSDEESSDEEFGQ